MYLGAQLFGVLANSSLAPAASLEKLRDIGYTHVEPCLALEPLGAYEQVIWPLPEFDGWMETISSLGLQVDTVHVFGSRLNAWADTVAYCFVRLFPTLYFTASIPSDLSSVHVSL